MNITYPNNKTENWQYTPLNFLADLPANANQADSVKQNSNADIFICNGRLVSKNLPDGVALKSSTMNIQPSDPATQGFVDQNQTAAISLDIEKNITLSIHVIGNNNAANKLQMNIAEGCQVTLHHTIETSGAGLHNNICQINLDKNAKLLHFIIPQGDHKARYFGYSQVNQDEKSIYTYATLQSQHTWSRQQIDVHLNKEKAETNLSAILLSANDDYQDHTITIHHHAESCPSNQIVRSIVNDKAKSVFQGKIAVDKIAQKTEGYQMARGIVLSETAQFVTKPELEIFADDVRCSHGATTGQLDQDALFYLQSRGIDQIQARRLLLQAFLADITNTIADDTIKDRMEAKINDWFAKNL